MKNGHLQAPAAFTIRERESLANGWEAWCTLELVWTRSAPVKTRIPVFLHVASHVTDSFITEECEECGTSAR